MSRDPWYPLFSRKVGLPAAQVARVSKTERRIPLR